MAYIVEQKIKGKIYLYQVTSYWDKTKKQARQKRTYIGPKERIYNKREKSQEVKKTTQPTKVVAKSYADVFLTNHLQQTLGITALLKQTFGSDYKQIQALACYFLQEAAPSYLFPHWHEEHLIEGVKKLHSQGVSQLYEQLGKSEFERFDFLKHWSNHLKPTAGLYYDITSVSSYSNNIEAVEWGYNRDKEPLPQINIGFLHCTKSGLPLGYNVHSGSIVDVSTLKNTVKTLEIFGLKDLFFILDRGFCSVSNLLSMRAHKLSFIQPLSFSLKKVKSLAEKHQPTLCRPANAFRYKEEILYHVQDTITIEKTTFTTHVYYNEKAAIDYKHYLYKSILEIEQAIAKLPSPDHQAYFETQLPARYKKFFVHTPGTGITRDQQTLDAAIFRAGTMIFAVESPTPLTNLSVLTHYKNRDKVEKEIHALKNHLDGGRLRAHSDATAQGRLFIKFISLIIHTHMLRVIKAHKTLSHYSVNEIMAELRKVKVIFFSPGPALMTALTKKQKTILTAFGINLDDFCDNIPSD